MIYIVLGLLASLIAYGLYIAHHAHRADWGHWILNTIDGLNRILCQRYHRLSPTTVALPATGGAVLAANHISGLDPLILAAISHRPVRFMIAREQYERFGMQWLFRAMGCIPVDRKGRPEKSLRDALRALQTGEIIGIFPQGTIQQEEQSATKLKGGVVRLAAWGNVPVYPIHISGVGGIGSVITAPFIRSHLNVFVSPAIHCDIESMPAALGAIQQAINSGKK